jgi:hypothetical protein
MPARLQQCIAAFLICKEVSAADRDIMTRALKMYGDALDGGCQGDSREQASHLKMLRSVMLLICLTEQHVVRFLPQVLVNGLSTC